jgi:hypothetical protein
MIVYLIHQCSSCPSPQKTKWEESEHLRRIQSIEGCRSMTLNANPRNSDYGVSNSS